MHNFLKLHWPVVLIVAAIAAVIAIFALGFSANAAAFREACSKSGGTTVYDGRQYQCMKP